MEENVQPGQNPDQENQKSERFESDTQKLVKKHLEDPDHVFSDEEIESIRVGMTPPDAVDTTLQELEEKVLKEKPADNKTEPGNQESDGRITPWDAIEPT